jgi:hydrogenase 3 maturation protease
LAIGTPNSFVSPDDLAQELVKLLSARSVIVCVGNELGGDDAAGPEVAQRIIGRVRWPVFDVHTVPENFLMKIVEAKPDVVLIVDALDFGAPAGAVSILPADSVAGQGPSTHGPAPIAFMDVLNMLHPCRRAVLGVQAKSVRFGDTISAEVARGVELVASALILAGGAAVGHG